MRRGVLLAMVPVNLVLLAWVWLGRLTFGAGGWFMVLLIPVVAVLAVGLLITTVMALTQSPRVLTSGQARAQLLTWLGMLGFGAFLPDFGDTDDSARSLLTRLFGYSDSLYDAGFTVALVFAAFAVIGYLALLVLLVARRRAS